MLRDFLINKWFLGGIGFLVVFAVVCELWYQHDTAPEKKAATEGEQMLRQTAEKLSTDGATPEKLSTDGATPAVLKDDAVGETQNAIAGMPLMKDAKPIHVSPYGLGPFPKIPKHSPIPPDWFDYPRSSKKLELTSRVIVKLWQDGKSNYGGTTSSSTGLFYPTFPNRIIVEWTSKDTPFGTIRYATRISWCPEAEGFQQQMKGKTIYEGDFPSRFTIVERKDAGIDPYEYLDLPR